MFLAFGSRKFVRPSTRVRPELNVLRAEEAAEWATTLLAGSGIDPAQRNASVTFHADGEQSYQALLALFAGAEDQLEV